ncbi:MAG: hypothetical protein ACR2RF_10865 [Geminicoccaceae bacterium]
MNAPKKSKLAELVGDLSKPAHDRRPTADELDRIATMPRRDAPPEPEGFDQVNIKAPVSVIRRFKEEARIAGGQAKLLKAMLDERQGR